MKYFYIILLEVIKNLITNKLLEEKNNRKNELWVFFLILWIQWIFKVGQALRLYLFFIKELDDLFKSMLFWSSFWYCKYRYYYLFIWTFWGSIRRIFDGFKLFLYSRTALNRKNMLLLKLGLDFLLIKRNVRHRRDLFFTLQWLSNSLCVRFGGHLWSLAKESIKDGIELLDRRIIIFLFKSRCVHFLFYFLLVILFFECYI